MKINRFKSSENKVTDVYILTPQCIEQKAKITVSFLNLKMKEYEEIKKQIKEITREIGDTSF